MNAQTEIRLSRSGDQPGDDHHQLATNEQHLTRLRSIYEGRREDYLLMVLLAIAAAGGEPGQSNSHSAKEILITKGEKRCSFTFTTSEHEDGGLNVSEFIIIIQWD